MCECVCTGVLPHRAEYSLKGRPLAEDTRSKRKKTPNIKSNYEINPEQLKWKKKVRQSCVVNITVFEV